MKRCVTALVVLAALFAAALGFAQNPTGTLSGRVNDGQGPLPGVTITATSAYLQGARSAITTENGDYIFRFLPPGDYRIKFELQGFTTLDQTIKISAGVNSRLDATMPQAKVAEEVTVAGNYETISTTTQASTTYEKSLIDKLPLGRTITSYMALSPGVSPGVGGYQISGAQSYDNLYLVNGVVVNENLRGQASSLFIEDAIQETTTSTAGISAEYGRFAGGVVNTLTKSGGNEVHGSYRLSLTNEKWTAPTALTVTRVDKNIPVHEATLGGYVVRDRLWYFGAGRYNDTKGSDQTVFTQIPFPTGTKQKRYEVKLTGAITPSHRAVGSYISRERSFIGTWDVASPIMDLNGQYDAKMPEALYAYNYTGVLSDNFFVEGQYSKRTLVFQNFGSAYTDLQRGTPIFDGDTGYVFNSAPFCGVCGSERRDNDDMLVKGSWFLSTARLGSHDIVFGYDTFNDMVKSNNYQSGSNFFLWNDTTKIGPNRGSEATLYPVILPESNSYIQYWPIFNFSKGTNFRTNSVFVNDRWRLSNNLSFNVGLRYDQNNGKDADGKKVTDDRNISPRLGVTWDPTGDGAWLVTAAYAKYVTAIANNAADSSATGGSPANILFYYMGPAINANCDQATGANCVSARDTITQVFNWLNAVGGVDTNDPNILVWKIIPGQSKQIRTSLRSPNAEEISLGLTKRFGSRGMVRADLIHRSFGDFYINRIDRTTGQVELPDGSQADLTLVENSPGGLSRTYDAVQSQFSFKALDSLSVGGSYTWSRLKGNFVGETVSSGPVPAGTFRYPEYNAFAQNNPTGLLSTDTTHRARLYLMWDAISTKHNRLSVSILENLNSGQPYSANSTITIRPYVSAAVAAQYVTPPAYSTYYFTARDAYRTPTTTSTDLSVTYSFVLPALGKEIELFVTPQVTNVFNEQKLLTFNQTVYTSRNAGKGLSAFNPFTTTPKECPQGATAATCAGMGANWQKGPTWGQAERPADYQAPRTFTVSMGVRF